MIQAVVGSGGKTTLIHRLAEKYRSQGKTVFVTTTTHMRIEPDTLLTDNAEEIRQRLKETGYAMAGQPEGEKITSLSPAVYKAACACADMVLVEADGSRGMPLKHPSGSEPVIPDNADEILVVCGLNALGRPAKEVCHRLEKVTACLGIDGDAKITPQHIQRLLNEGYLEPLRAKYPGKTITLVPRTDGSLYQRAVAALLKSGMDAAVLRPEWFLPQPRLIVCGAGHVGREVAELASRLDFTTRVLDDRPDLLTRKRFPTADELVCDSFDHLAQHLEPGACYVVVTPNHRADYQCVASILPTEYSYLGMMGSRHKAAATFARLREAGFAEKQIRRIFAPIGLPIGAVTPAEIAISILSQIIQEKSRNHVASAERSLLESREPGVLCIVIGAEGSVPRGAGSMMLVGRDHLRGSIGGGQSEYLAIRRAKELTGCEIQEYQLHHGASSGLDMVCGGNMRVLFLPV